MTVGGTQAEYVVDIWSGNHPFFQGVKTAVMTNAGRVSRFGDRFGDLGAMSEVETMDKANGNKSIMIMETTDHKNEDKDVLDFLSRPLDAR